MSGNKEKWLKTMIAKHGSKEGVRKVLELSGRAGGKKSSGKKTSETLRKRYGKDYYKKIANKRWGNLKKER